MESRKKGSEFDVVIIGAGAAGQIAAIMAAENKKRVALLEQMSSPGMKLLASGGGRANLTNLLDQSAFIDAFGKQGRFMEPALSAFPPSALREFMLRLGVKTTADEHLRVYPASQKSTDVQSAFDHRIKQLGVDLQLNCPVNQLWIEQGKLKGVITPGRRIRADSIILACGGQSWPGLGGTGGGYALARQAGHTIIEPTPALVPLITQETWPSRLAGLSLSNVRLWIAMPGQSKAGVTGDVLFTHRGLSGPAVINLSGDVAQLLRNNPSVPIHMELVAGVSVRQWEQTIESWRTTSGKRPIVSLLKEKIPAALSRELCQQASLNEQTLAAQLPADGRRRLAELLGSLGLMVVDTEGFGTAFVTRGGVKLKEVKPQTLESRLVSGLYFAGELLDLDGPTGGFNLHWAFASGHLAGMNA